MHGAWGMGHGAWGWIYMAINWPVAMYICVCMGIKLHGKRKQIIENKLAINDTVHFFPQLVLIVKVVVLKIPFFRMAMDFYYSN